MKNFIKLSLIITLLFVTSFNSHGVLKSVKVNDFNNLRVVDDIYVEYYCDASKAGTIEFDLPKEVAKLLIFDCNDKGKLKIDMAFDDSQTIKQPPTIKVYSSRIEEVVNQGKVTVTVNLPKKKINFFRAVTTGNGKLIVKNLNTDKGEMKIATGNGTITASGKCKDLKISCLGKGLVDTRKTISTNVSCKLTGTSNVHCNVNGGKLNIRGSGSGKVYYTGNPSNVSIKKIGSIKAIKEK